MRSWLDEFPELFNVPIQFGLRQQGKLDTVAKLLEEGISWEEIGRAIGWDGQTAKRFYEMETEQDA